VLAFVLGTGLGTRALTRRRFRLPIALVVIVGFIFLRSVPTTGNDVSFDVILGLVGLGFGVLAGSLMAVRCDRPTDLSSPRQVLRTPPCGSP
jgi:hypothetical protein